MSTISSGLRAGSSVNPSRRFPLAVALAMLAVNIVGFSPTLYFRAFFDVPPISPYLYVHGALGTAWFALLVVQAALVANRRTDIHRKLGWAGVAIAVGVLAVGVYTSTNMVPRNMALGPLDAAEIRLFSGVTAADIAGFIVFPTFVALGVALRRRPEVHRRLMLLASFSIIGPAVARIASWFGELPNPVSFGIIASFALALLVYDTVTRRRPHIATVLGVLFFYTVNFGMQLSGIGAALVAERMAQ